MVRPELVGTWRLVDYVLTADGSQSHPWDGDAAGLLIYAADGHMSVSVDQPDGSGGRRHLTYCGRLERRGDENLHTIEISSDPDLVGTVQHRDVMLDGDTMTLRSSPTLAFGPGSAADIVWRRATPGPA